MTSLIGRVVTPDGTELLTRHWPAADAWASLLLVHGLGEHSARYEHVGDHLAAAGIDTHAYDHRGNGGSGGPKGDIDRWSRFHDDLEERLAAVRAGADGRPVVLYAHSMGGLVAAGYLIDGRPRPDFTVLSAPGLDSTLARWKLALAPLCARIAPGVSLGQGIRPETLSRDPEVGRQVRADPLNVSTNTFRFGAEAVREQARVRELAHEIGGPTLVMHGLDDGLVPPSATEVFEGVPGVERRTYPGLRHELHNEPEGLDVVDDVIAWLEERARLSPQPNTASGERIER
ncbi:MAG TPA: alpha/beta hydrolase [Candidatus Limnocylindrales bacterium]|nr:alpha/beta hydrolase [Candidatus Limnocylindrales bacterium]